MTKTNPSIMRQTFYPRMMRISLALAGGFLFASLALVEAAPAAKQAPTLKAAAAGLFDLGVGLTDRIAERPSDWALLTNHFSYLRRRFWPPAIRRHGGKSLSIVPLTSISN